MANPVLSLRGVTKRFGGLQALTDVTFDLPEGQILGLIGPNGAGKTTLLKVLMNLERSSDGQVTVLGMDSRREGPRVRAQIGFPSKSRGPGTRGSLSFPPSSFSRTSSSMPPILTYPPSGR